MTKTEFMQKLNQLLQDISQEEREAAISYYEGYFEDAGEENVDSVIKELGSPERVAKNLKRGLEGKNFEEDYIDPKDYEGKYEVLKGKPGEDPQKGTTNDEKAKKSKTSNDTKIVLIIVACVVLWPLVFGVGGSLLGAIVCVLATFVGLTCAGWAMLLAALGLFIFGIVCTFHNPALGIFVISCSLIVAAFGLAFVVLTIWLWSYVVPYIFRGIKKVWNSIFHKEETA